MLLPAGDDLQHVAKPACYAPSPAACGEASVFTCLLCCVLLQGGYLVHVMGRDVDIGTSACNLFCFTLARAMMSDSIDCTCDSNLAAQLMPAGNMTHDIADTGVCSSTPVMCSINAYAFTLYKRHMTPAVVCITLALLSLAGLLMLVSGTFARALTEQRSRSISRCSSADVQMRVDGSEDVTPRKGGDVVV